MTARHLLLAGLLVAALGQASVVFGAQYGAPQYGAPQYGAAPDGGDPPARVGRLAQITGTVSFHTSDESQWEAATLNYPITSGNSLWTEPQSHAAVDIGGSRIYLDGSTELDIGTLNDQGFLASLPQGAVFLRVGNDGGFEIDTPRGAVTITQPGHYEIVAGDADHPTTVAALDGAAQIGGPGLNTTVAAGQTAFLTGQNPVTANLGPVQQDAFVQYVSSAEQPYATPGPAQQYVSPGATGYQDLNQYGQWQQSPDYGAVWMPQVAAGWAPYRYGHWAFIAPWGWTWIDDAPWGFAPFHYGRWVEIGGGWGWAPGIIVAQPVYAPALVSFFGDFGGVGIGVSFGFGPAVGWVPLGPNEVWIPPYHCGPRYIHNVNITNVNITKIVNINNTTIINNKYVNNYANHRGATVVPASAMVGSRSIGKTFQGLPANGWQQKLARVTAQGSQAPVKPTLRTAGLTPSAARQFGQVLPANGQLPGRPRAAGPVIAADNRGGPPLGNGRNLPSFATEQQKGSSTQPQGGGRFASLAPGQSFGGFGQKAQGQSGQTLLKNGAPGPAIQPHNNGGAGTNRSFASLGNAGAGQNRTQGQGQGWSFLPPLQKKTQGSAGSVTGLQPGSSVWSQQPAAPKANANQSKAATQGQALKQGQGLKQTQGAGQTWASLPPLQKQPQASRNGQVGYQSSGSWQQPQVYRATGGSTPPSTQGSSRTTKQTGVFPAAQGQSQTWKAQGQGNVQRTKPQQPQANRQWQQGAATMASQGASQGTSQGGRNAQTGGGFALPQPQKGNWQQGQGKFAFQPPPQQPRQPQQQPTSTRNGKNLFPNQQGGS